jgi:hypothetical protein
LHSQKAKKVLNSFLHIISYWYDLQLFIMITARYVAFIGHFRDFDMSPLRGGQRLWLFQSHPNLNVSYRDWLVEVGEFAVSAKSGQSTNSG